MQKGKITDYESFQNEINILMTLVSQKRSNSSVFGQTYFDFSHYLFKYELARQSAAILPYLRNLSDCFHVSFYFFRTTQTSSSYMRLGKLTAFVSLSQSKEQL